MRRKALSRLGETEMEVLQHVWALGEASVADVHSSILKDRAVAYTTVMTVMRKLAQKGFLHCDSSGPRYMYTPARTPALVRQELVQDLLDQVFQGSASALVQTLVRSEQIPPAERAEIQRLLTSLAEREEPDA